MIANSAFLAAMILILVGFFLMGRLECLAAYKHSILPQYLWNIVGALVLVFLNLFGLFYLTTRRLFLKETGRKLAHIEKQLQTGDTVVRDLSDRLAEEE
jgi:hypothetical protein